MMVVGEEELLYRAGLGKIGGGVGSAPDKNFSMAIVLAKSGGGGPGGVVGAAAF